MSVSWITTEITEELLRGAFVCEPTTAGLRPQRLPAWARAQLPDEQTRHTVQLCSGVRLVFRTEATQVHLCAIVEKNPEHEPWKPPPVYDVYLDGDLLTQRSIEPPAAGEPAVLTLNGLPRRMKHLEIWLPYDEPTVLVSLHSDAPLLTVQPRKPLWLHHGSSISHGSDAIGASHTWVGTAARSAGVDLLNLGLAGNAMLDQFTARTIGAAAADMISCKLGINVVNGDTHRMRSFVPALHGFLDTIRDGHPQTPLLFVSPLWCGIHETTPGPLTWAVMEDAGQQQQKFWATGNPEDVQHGRLTLQIIRQTMAAVMHQRMETDPHLYFLDGLELYNEEDAAQYPMPDDLHPGPEAHQLIGERFAASVFGPTGSFGPAALPHAAPRAGTAPQAAG